MEERDIRTVIGDGMVATLRDPAIPPSKKCPFSFSFLHSLITTITDNQSLHDLTVIEHFRGRCRQCLPCRHRHPAVAQTRHGLRARNISQGVWFRAWGWGLRVKGLGYGVGVYCSGLGDQELGLGLCEFQKTGMVVSSTYERKKTRV